MSDTTYAWRTPVPATPATSAGRSLGEYSAQELINEMVRRRYVVLGSREYDDLCKAAAGHAPDMSAEIRMMRAKAKIDGEIESLRSQLKAAASDVDLWKSEAEYLLAMLEDRAEKN